MTRALLLASGAILLAASSRAQDAAGIVRKSVERDAYNFARLRNYTFLERNEERRYSRNGNLNSREVETYEIMILGGRPYGRLVQRDDKPLSEKENRKEQEKMDKELAKRQKESASEKAGHEKERAEERRYLREVPDAFVLRMKGADEIGGRPVWVIDAQPKAGYRPRIKRAELLTKLRGTLWIDQGDYQWVKADVDVIQPISFGLGLFRISPGGSLEFEQVRVNEEVWLPSRIAVRADARLAYVKKVRGELDVVFSKYKKFQADSVIVGVEETAPPK